MNHEEVQTIQCGLALTLDPVNQNFAMAEDMLAKLRFSSTFLNSLTLLISRNDTPNNIRIAASSVLCRELNWAYTQEFFPYDLSILKGQIIGMIALYFEQRVLKDKFEEILQVLVQKEYPVNWEGLLEMSVSQIKQAKDPKQLYGALTILYSIFHAYKFQINEDRLPLNLLIPQVFPYFEHLLVTGLKEPSREFLPILLILLKTFYSANYIELNDYLTTNVIKIWSFAAKTILERGMLPQEAKPARNWSEMCELEKREEFKVKKAALDVLNKLAQHVSSRSSQFPTIADDFLIVLPSLIDSMLNFINSANFIFGLKPENNQNISEFMRVCTANCVAQAYSFLRYAFKINFSVKEIFSVALSEFIIYEIAIYSFQVNEFELELYSENQAQYVYSENNETNDPVMHIKRSAAEVLTIVCDYEPEMAKEFARFVIVTSSTLVNPRNNQPVGERFIEGLLYGLQKVIGSSRKLLSGGIEEIVTNLLLPQLNATQTSEFTKARICSVIQIINSTQACNEQTLRNLSACICRCLGSNDSLFCNLKALYALAAIVGNDVVPPMLIKDLDFIFEHIFALMRKIHLDETLVSLNAIIGAFGCEVRPYAHKLLASLLENFWSIVNSSEDLSKEEDETTAERSEQIDAIESSLNTMADILMLELPQSFMKECKQWIIDIFSFMIECKGLRQIFEAALNLFNVYIYRVESIDDDLWFFYPIICYALVGRPTNTLQVSFENLSVLQARLMKADLTGLLIPDLTFSFEIFLALLGNFVQKGKQFILVARDFYNKSFFEYIFEISDQLIQNGLGEHIDLDLICAVRVISLLSENCLPELRSNIPVYEEIIKYLANFLNLERDKTLKVVALQKICLLLYMDASLFMHISGKLGLRQRLLYQLCGLVDLFENSSEKEILLMGIVGIYRLPSNQLFDIPLIWLSNESYSVCMDLKREDMRDLPSSKNGDIEVESGIYVNDENEEDDESWHEDDYLEEKSLDYKDPFEDVVGVLELKATWELIEQRDPHYFQTIINELNSTKRKDMLDCFSYFAAKNSRS
jgi:hypothetical protein